MKRRIFICPPTSLILSDIVERMGHIPLTMMNEIKFENGMEGSKEENAFEPRRGLRYAPVEVPSGVRGRLSIIGALIDKAEAAIIMEDADFGFGCGGCARTNELIPYIVSQQGIPFVKVVYPHDLESAKEMVKRIKDFLTGLEVQ